MSKTLILFLFIIQINYGQKSDFKHLDFEKADSIALAHKGESLKNLPSLTHKLTVQLTTDTEKLRSIYYWICTNIKNDYSSYLTTSKKRKRYAKDRSALLNWNKEHTRKVFKTLVKHRKTACTGYAYLLREMLTLAGIKSKIIDGYGRTATIKLNEQSLPNHSWNAVELNGKWYLCDPTWSSGLITINDNIPQFQQEYFDGYFLARPEDFIANHYPLEKEWTLMDNPPTLIQYIEAPIIYKEAFSHKTFPNQPEKMFNEVAKNGQVHFSMHYNEDLHGYKVELILAQGKLQKTFHPSTFNENGTLNFHHTFDKRGIFDVHIKIGEDIIASYVVTVRKKK